MSIQGFRDGTAGTVQGWDVAETGYNYIFKGPATGLGANTYYTQVTFADGKVLKSNSVYTTVLPAGTKAVNQAPSNVHSCQTITGIGIVAGTPSGVSSEVSISNNTVADYHNDGILCWEAGITCEISDNYVSPLLAAASTSATNGIQVIYGGTGKLTGNTIVGNVCDIPGVCGPGLVGQQQGCGIMTYLASSGVNMSDNEMLTNDIGICLGADFKVVSSIGNNIVASTFAGIEVYDESQVIVGSAISDSQFGIVPISDDNSYPANVGYNDTFTSVGTSCHAIQVITGIATCAPTA